MQSALKFLAVEAGAVGGAVFGRFGAVPVAHGDVTFFGEWVMGKLVLMKKQIHLRIRPIEDRVNFERSLLLLCERSILARIRV